MASSMGTSGLPGTRWRLSLEREGYVFQAGRGELRDLALSIASHALNTEQVAAWLEQRSGQI
jgi:hypothetical protein